MEQRPLPPARRPLPRFRADGLDQLRRPIWVLDTARKRKVFANAAALELWSAESEAELFARDFNPHSPAIRKRLQDTIDRISAGEVFDERWTFYPKGRPFTVDSLVSGVILHDGTIGMLVEAAPLQIMPEELRAVEALRHTLVKVSLYDRDGRILFRNPAAARCYPAPDHAFVNSFSDPALGRQLWSDALAKLSEGGNAFMGQAVSGIFRMRTDAGERWHGIDARSTSDPVTGQACLLVNERDVTEQTEARERIEYLALHDTVTGLANRASFAERLAGAMTRPDAGSGALLLIDLDDFKEINDTFGHGAGDAVLREIGARLRSIARPQDVGARLGGDEFALILPGVSEPEAVARRAEELNLRLAHPIEDEAFGDTRRIGIRASVGTAVWPHDGASPDSLLRNADLALYAAKAEGGHGCRHFNRTMRQAADAQRELVEDLRRAIARDEIEVHFQPLVTLSEVRVAGFEALVRWRHPVQGLLAPDRFLPVAEAFGIAGAIGRIVIETAARQMRHWIEAGLDPGRMAINLGANQLQHPDLAAQITRMVAETGVAPERFEYEVPETVTLGRGGDEVIGVLSALRERGFGIALDDFGTGHASLTHLRRLPIDKIKIDRSFIVEMNRSPADLAIVRAVINLGHDLGMTVLAEGVETQAQADLLLGLGCDQAQGYLFGRPMAAAAAGAWLRSRPALAAERGILVNFPAGR
ncbi:putative bifunctional diguanylate cyclase/phosphodiesterase [Ancylobacter terrae]|uniref:putative bifunctional diguanylate cyclase/phosphodiesterase n=1 Tax=Ancylobacter sp. sgz301288 TaxID=3342077 RepID=UPI00385D97A0